MARIAFIGLGVMGGPMARHLAAAGHEAAVFNRTRAKAEAWVAAHGGRVAAPCRAGAVHRSWRSARTRPPERRTWCLPLRRR